MIGQRSVGNLDSGNVAEIVIGRVDTSVLVDNAKGLFKVLPWTKAISFVPVERVNTVGKFVTYYKAQCSIIDGRRIECRNRQQPSQWQHDCVVIWDIEGVDIKRGQSQYSDWDEKSYSSLNQIVKKRTDQEFSVSPG